MCTVKYLYLGKYDGREREEKHEGKREREREWDGVRIRRGLSKRRASQRKEITHLMLYVHISWVYDKILLQQWEENDI